MFVDKLTTPRKKKKGASQASRDNVVLTTGEGIQDTENLFHVFKTACNVWSMLNNDYSKGIYAYIFEFDIKLPVFWNMTKIDIVTELTDTSILQNQDQIIWSITNIGISSEFDQYGHVI